MRFPGFESTLTSGAHVVLGGNERARKRDAERVGEVDPASPVEVTVTLRDPRTYSDDAGEVKRVLARFGLATKAERPVTGSLVMTGTAAQIEAAFHPGLGMYSHGRTGCFAVARVT